MNRSIPALNSGILDSKLQNHVAAVSVSPDVSQGNMDRSCLSACCTKTDCVRINGGRIKSVHTENCHIDIFGAVWIYSVGILLRSDVNGNQHRSPKFNRPDIADADTGIS